jgi:peptidylprolyl isomerase/peptidyl-prolyl cis-trans isomerase B (cyclophilin B)
MGLFGDKIKEFSPLPEGAQPKISIELEKGGKVELELYPDVAPQHVASFLELIEKNFYDGLTFHRVIPGFVAQGGCPKGTGTGGPGYNVKAEFNAKQHLTGTLAMARAADPDSAGSQFYICLAPQPSLDGSYTVFGQVTEGMDLVQKIKVGDRMVKITVLSK